MDIVRKRYYKSGAEHQASSRRKVHGSSSDAVPGPQESPVALPTPRPEELRLGLLAGLSAGRFTVAEYDRLVGDLERIERDEARPSG